MANIVPASNNGRNLRSIVCTNSSSNKLGSVLEPPNESEPPKNNPPIETLCSQTGLGPKATELTCEDSEQVLNFEDTQSWKAD
jgi:hypothetical protein